MILVGERAPDVRLQSDAGTPFHLAEHQGRTVVLWFHPHDNIPVFMHRAVQFRNRIEQFRELDVEVVAVTPDSAHALRGFKHKLELPFTLLSDSDHAVAEIYGAYGETSVAGRHYKNVIPTTYLIDPEGTVQAVWPDVREDEHVEQVLEELAEQRGM